MTNESSSEVTADTTQKRPRKTQVTIRNLRGTVVHMRLYSQNPKDPYRIELKPRGTQGDWTTVAAKYSDDPTLLQSVGVLVEVIPMTEAKALQATYGPVGYLGRTDAPQIIRPEDTTISTADNWDGKGTRPPQDRNFQMHERGSEMNQADRVAGTGMNLADVPGSDIGLHAGIRAQQEVADPGNPATPEGVDLTSRKVVIEHVKGQ